MLMVSSIIHALHVALLYLSKKRCQCAGVLIGSLEYPELTPESSGAKTSDVDHLMI